MCSLSAPHSTKSAAAAAARSDAERSINSEAELISLRRRAATWGANESEESITSLEGRWEALGNWFPAAVVYKGVQYASVEHGFQSAKAAAEPEEVREAIRKEQLAQFASEVRE